jgi:hypothetical protein
MSTIVIQKIVTLEQVRAANPKMIWYGANTCWWTHLAEDLREASRLGRQALPSDPRGGMLFETINVEAFLRAAEESPDHYGKHGLAAFMAAHHRNCLIGRAVTDSVIVLATSARPWCMPTWQEYNEAIDATQRREERGTT